MNSSKATAKIVLLICTLVIGLTGFGGTKTVSAEEVSQSIVGTIYKFGEKGKYKLEEAKSKLPTDKATTYGELKISGAISKVGDEKGMPTFAVSEGNLEIAYTYDDKLLKASKDKKHLEEDKISEVDGIKLSDDIMNGVILLQTSKDGKIWFNASEQEQTNVFEATPVQSNSFYTTTNVQLVNGTYYKVIVAYKTGIRTQEAQVFPPKLEKTDYTKYAEVYEFYAYNEAAAEVDVPEKENRRNLGTKIRTKSDGYAGEAQMDNEDPHFGWDIGQFFVGGYTDYKDDKDGSPVFLKNNGDQLSLWFELQQDITQCFNNSDIRVVPDAKGSDAYFEIPGGVKETIDFGKGALIVRKTNYDNTKDKPQIYVNYLEASASVDAVTKVDLFEEGDYEVALNYAVKFDKTKILGKSVLPQTANYRIFFKFSVRNGNSIVFLFDQKTGSELSSGSTTENGFRLDLANSKYLKVRVKREVLKDGVEGLTEDTRFNSSASDGDVFIDEGVYTVTVTNQYNDATTEKKLYVGNNDILKAYMVSGLTISEIKEMISQGAEINEDGTISFPQEEVSTEIEDFLRTESNTNQKGLEDEQVQSGDNNPAENQGTPIMPIVLVVSVLVAAGFIMKKKNSK